LLFVNRTGHDLDVEILGWGLLSITDDSGQPYTIIYAQEGSAEERCYLGTDRQVSIDTIESGSSAMLAFRVMDLPPQDASEITVTVNRAWEIEGATWSIEIP